MDRHQSLFIFLIAFSYCLNKCISSEFECKNEMDFMCHSDKRCIDSSLVCDGNYDCIDHSDEKLCGEISFFIFFFVICF